MATGGKLKASDNPLDGRQKLVNVADIEALEQFRSVGEERRETKLDA